MYIYKSVTHTDTSKEYMAALGMTDEQIESVLNQVEFETTMYIAQRKDAYTKESDYLFMAAQFDGTTEAVQVWKDKVTEIKARYPKGV